MRSTDRHVSATPALRLLPAAVLATMLAACGGDRAPSAPAAAGSASEVPGSAAQVERRIGSTLVHAYAMQTSAIPGAVAREHGIEQAPERIMLRVSGRTGDADAASVPLQVAVRVSDLQGKTQALPVREVVVNGLTDYVATVTTSLPDTLRFEVDVTTPDGLRETLQLTRDFDRP